MKKILLGVFLMISVGLSAQLSINPSNISVNDVPSVSLIVVDFTVENQNSTEGAEYLWRILDHENYPADWHVHICDTNNCYFHTIHTCPDNAPNLLDPSASFVMQFNVDPRGQEADHTFTVELFDVNDPTNVYTTVEITVNTLVSSTDEAALTSNLALYPNPTTESFQIMNDLNVQTIAIYNIVGKQINKFEHEAGQLYYVNNLRKGMYLVRLFDESGNTIKALRLSKD